MRLFAIFGMFLVTGCATSTGVVPIGQDTYMIGKSTNLQVSSSGIKANAFREAQKFCAKQSKQVQVVRTSEKDMVLGSNMATVELQFMCLSEGDAELQRPKLQKEADKVVNVNSKVNVKPNSSNTQDMYTELKKLKELKDSDIITQEEFEIEKKKILSRY